MLGASGLLEVNSVEVLLVALPTELMARFKKKGLKIKKWLGYQDSNLGYTGSKPDALPLGYSPTI
jgi:hypothetical protein